MHFLPVTFQNSSLPCCQPGIPPPRDFGRIVTDEVSWDADSEMRRCSPEWTREPHWVQRGVGPGRRTGLSVPWSQQRPRLALQSWPIEARGLGFFTPHTGQSWEARRPQEGVTIPGKAAFFGQRQFLGGALTVSWQWAELQAVEEHTRAPTSRENHSASLPRASNAGNRGA